MIFDHDFKNRINRATPKTRQLIPSGGWMRLPLLIGSLSVIGVVLASTKPTEPQDLHSAQSDLNNLVSEALQIPKPDSPEPIASNPAETDTNWTIETVQAGDSASSVFSRLNIHSHLHNLLEYKQANAALTNIRPGEVFKARYTKDNNLEKLVYSPAKTNELQITTLGEGYQIRLVEHPIDTRRVTSKISINESMYTDGKKAGLTANVIMQVFSIFAYDIDFALDIRNGDSFTVIYDERFLNGEKLKDGPIQAVEFVNKGKTFAAYRYTDTAGNSDYYDENGRSLRKAFIRTPIKFARISSHFNPSRLHPILHTIRAHKGVDYAAPTGTPIKATGSGKVIFKGRKNGYGKTVILQHGKTYTTLYAHMSNFDKKLAKGGTVQQGQIIGYVGQTGGATGPHLHYEFRVNNVHKNPITVKLPNSAPLAKSELMRFTEQTRQIAKQLSAESTQIAKK